MLTDMHTDSFASVTFDFLDHTLDLRIRGRDVSNSDIEPIPR
jgi:hypothetical protein